MLVLFVALLFSLPVPVLAIGQITDPIAISDALRGQSYERIITVVNTEKLTTEITLSAGEDIADWVRFYADSASKDAIDKITLPAGGKQDVIARFTIPPSAPNKTYTGTISVSGKPGEFKGDGSDSGSAVTQKIDREVTIGVSDKEVVDFAVSLIPETYDLNRGDFLKIRVQYDNRSNIDIRPQIDLKITDGGETVYSAIFPYPENAPSVKPAAIYEIPALEIPTSNLDNGNFKAIFKLSEDDKFSLDKEFGFSLGMVKGASATAAGTGASGLFWADLNPLARAFLAMGATLFIILVLRQILRKPKSKYDYQL